MAERRRSARHWITGVTTVAVLGGGAGAWAAMRPSDPAYRLASAGPAEVTSTLSATGTIQSVNQATLSFPVSGTVSAVNVQVGQQVSAGQVVAALDTTTVSSQVVSAQSRLATAQAKLASDQDRQTAAAQASPAPAKPSTANASGTSRSPGGDAKPIAPPPQLASAQDTVKTSQQQVDSDLTAVSSLAGREKTTCDQAMQSASSSSTGSSQPSTSTEPTPSRTTSSAPSSGSGGSEAVSECTSLIQQVMTAQSKTAADEKALSDAENSLNTVLGQAIASVNRAASAASQAAQAPQPASQSRGTQPSSQSRSTQPPSQNRSAQNPSAQNRSGTTATAPPSADQLAADQASVDSANADLVAAQQNLDAATLISPIAGTVAQVGVAAGQTVAGASEKSNIVIIGPGSDEVTTSVSDVQLGQVHPGQDVTVTPDGTGLRLTGKVASVGVLPGTSGSTTGTSPATSSGASSSGTSYPVTISLDPTSQQLFAGATAAVSIMVGGTHASVTVPTSAVRAAGSRHIVSVLRNGTLIAVPVTVGVVGATLTEVTSGLRVGDQVVLANLDTPLPSGNTTQRGFGGGGFARPGGGGGAGRGD